MAKKSTLIIDGHNKGAITAVNQTTSRLGQAVGQVKGMGNGLTSAMSGFTGILTRLPMMASVAAIGIVTGFAAMIKKSIDLSESFDKMSQRAGVSVEFLSTMKYAVELGGASIEQLEKGVKTLSRNLYDFSKGAGQTVKYALEDLGIAATDAKGNLRNTEGVVYEVADSFAKMEDGSKKTALAMSLFGKAGADLIPTLNQGSKALKEQQEEARKLGLEISTNTAKQAAVFKDNMLRLESSITGVANIVAQSLLPSLVNVSDALASVTSNTNSLRNSFGIIGNVFKGFITVASFALTNFITIWTSLIGLVEAGSKIITLNFADAGDKMTETANKIADNYNAWGIFVGKIWEETKDYETLLKELNAAQELEKNRLAAEKLAKEWERLNQKLSGDIAKSTLPAIAFEIYKIDQKFSEYTAKFPGHIAMINKWRDAMIEAATKPPELDLPEMPELEEIDITDFELNKYAIKQEALIAIRDLEISNILDTNAQKEALIQEEYARELAYWDEMLQNKLLSQENYNELFNGLNTQREIESTQLQLANQALREQALTDSLMNMSDAFSMFTNMSKTQNKAMFAVSKSFAIAEAGIATYLGATKALAMVELFPFNFVLAGSIIAQGLANVARIASMQPGSAASGGTASAPTASASPTGGGSSDNRQITYTINFYGGGFDGDKDRLARDLIDSINKAQEDGLILVGG